MQWLGMVVCISIGFSAAGHADEPPAPQPQPLSLPEARQIALSQSWDVLAAVSGISQAEAQKIIAQEFPNPELSLDVSAINVDGHPNTYETEARPARDVTLSDGSTVTIPGRSVYKNGLWDRTYDTVIAVTQLIEIGKRKHRIAAAAAGIAAAEAQFRDAKRVLDTEVVKAYGAAALAEANVRILQDSAASMREEARLAEVRERAGDISATDRTQIEVEAEKLANEAAAAMTEASSARIALGTLIGLPAPDDRWTPSDALETLAALPAPAPPDNAPERPDLAAAHALLDQAEAEVRGQKALRIPDPSVSLSYEHEPPDGPNSMGFAISIPVPLWNRYKGEIAAAAAARNDAAREIKRIEALIVSERNQANVAYAGALQRWSNYKSAIQPQSAQVRENLAFAYKQGGASLLDLLSAQRTDNEIRLETAQAAADTLSALADLAAAFNTQLNMESEVSQ